MVDIFSGACFNCGEVRHRAAECTSKDSGSAMAVLAEHKRDQIPKLESAQPNNTTMSKPDQTDWEAFGFMATADDISAQYGNDGALVLDSACTHHMVISRYALYNICCTYVQHICTLLNYNRKFAVRVTQVSGYILNRLIPSRTTRIAMPYELFYGSKLDICMARIFHCLTYAHEWKSWNKFASVFSWSTRMIRKMKTSHPL